MYLLDIEIVTAGMDGGSDLPWELVNIDLEAMRRICQSPGLSDDAVLIGTLGVPAGATGLVGSGLVGSVGDGEGSALAVAALAAVQALAYELGEIGTTAQGRLAAIRRGW